MKHKELSIRELFSKLRFDFEFKTISMALFSFGTTTAFALFNGYLGIRLSSLWHGSICVYYIVLVFLRGLILLAERRKASQGKASVVASAFLLLLNASLVVPVSVMVVQQRPVNMTLIPAISMAAYTTFKIVMASMNLRRMRKTPDSLVRILRTISFIDALVSILTLQNTLISVNSTEFDRSMFVLAAATSAVIFIAIMVISVISLRKSILRYSANNADQLN
ncbi:MAG: hypothetical protein IKR01_09035 [Spirochaetales bacterium]|nr:hypothetical protein [Spirochaetales bacterium]